MSERKAWRGMSQLGGRSRKSKSCVSRKSEYSERKACVKSLEGKSSRKVETCASGMEGSLSRPEARARAEEANESEMAEER